jgi:hypothetical protein
MDMLSYMLDLAEKDTPGDQYPSCYELAEMFDLKFRWVVSIGFALRTDTKYPVCSHRTVLAAYAVTLWLTH